MAKIHVRARAVDMLGRQQIAGIPTAIHEIFKNAHDAYAERVEADYYRSDGMLIIRDDGIGMTLQDFEGKWLTIGTDSKVGANDRRDTPWTGPRRLPVRPIMGEKGIGRLAIAAIGRQVLVMTRATRPEPEGAGPLVVSLIHWGVFEQIGINLDAIEVPVEVVLDGGLPDRATLLKLTQRILENIDSLGNSFPPEARERIEADLAEMNLDPDEIDRALGGMTLRGEGHGTHFLIRPVSDVLVDDIDGGIESGPDSVASPLEKMLLGFSNTMMPDRPEPVIRAEFRDHKNDGRITDLIGGRAFFTPEEFNSADHHIEGRFDEYGQFLGQVSIYRRSPQSYSARWPKSSGRKTLCGPFSVKFGYVQGKPTESMLQPTEYALLTAKLNRIGGLYVYRDGIRILPYGNSDYDFLSIELRRTKSASDWFFSYRRIYGVVEITHSANHQLVEKAGREGFRANRAYREFEGILSDFFQRLAVDFFRESAALGLEYHDIKTQLDRDAQLLKKRATSTRGRRVELSRQLDAFFKEVERGSPWTESARIKEEIESRLDAITGVEDHDRAVDVVLQVEADAREAKDKLSKSLAVAKPRGLGLNKSQQADWAAYVQNLKRIRQEVIEPLSRDIDSMISESAARHDITLNARRRITSTIEARRKGADASAVSLRHEVERELAEVEDLVSSSLRTSFAEFRNELESVLIDFERTATSTLSDSDPEDQAWVWEGRIERIASEFEERLEALRDQLVTLKEAIGRGETLDATTAAIETRAEAYREQLDQYVEWAQIGMAIGIVQHEFANTIRGIRKAIRDLKPWADGTPELGNVYRSLRDGFHHLDSYLAMFTPLSQRSNRGISDLSGEQIRRYLLEVFGDRLKKADVRLIGTPRFDARKVKGYASTLLPCFVNIVDNAIYWISTDAQSQKVITLDADEAGLLISNGGPGIERRVADRIFDFGETTKPGGRGIGLNLAREALKKDGYDLTLEAVGAEVHPVFKITPSVRTSDAEVAR